MPNKFELACQMLDTVVHPVTERLPPPGCLGGLFG
jgi:hypothetical protein